MKSSMLMLVAVAILGSLAACDEAPRAQTSKKTARPMRVIYNLDRSEFFVGTFGPVKPETIDKFVDAHAAAGVTEPVHQRQRKACQLS